MLIVVCAVYEYVIEVDDYEFVEKGVKYLVHQSHEDAGCIRKAKGHDHPFK